MLGKVSTLKGTLCSFEYEQQDPVSGFTRFLGTTHAGSNVQRSFAKHSCKLENMDVNCTLQK